MKHLLSKKSIVKLSFCLFIWFSFGNFVMAQAYQTQQIPAGISNEVEISTGHDHMNNKHRFILKTKEIPSGWTTFNFINATSYDHFFLLFKVPDIAIDKAKTAGIDLLEYWEENITKPFQHSFNPYIKGEIPYESFIENLFTAVSTTAPWYFDPGAPTSGGGGFTSAGRKSITIIEMAPGKYIMECYIKDDNEYFHSYLGMSELLTVSSQPSLTKKPVPNAKVTISSTTGIKVVQPAKKGLNIIEFFFEDQSTYEHLLGHNVQLVKMGERKDENALNDLFDWMDWTKHGALKNQAPHGFRFLGGTMEMQSGDRSYIQIDLQPGDYAWIAEVPDPKGKNMFVTFRIE